MAVSKRLRFEVLRRDNHACRYCGESAPGVKLVVDHVVPSVLGGRDEPENLVTACEPCNSGKSSTQPEAPLVGDVRADAIRWSRALRVVAETRALDQEVREAYAGVFLAHWNEWNYGPDKHRVQLPSTWQQSIEKFCDLGLPESEMARAIRKAMARDDIPPDLTFRYFCGTCWGILRDIQDAAADVFMADLEDEIFNSGDEV